MNLPIFERILITNQIMKPFYFKTFIFFTTLFLFFSCQEDGIYQEPQVLDNTSINDKIISIIKEKGDFSWDDFSDEEAWSAFQYANNYVSVAWDVASVDDKEKEEIINFIHRSEGISNESIVTINTNLNVLLAKIKKKETFIGLRNMDVAEAVEPAYEIYTKADAIEAAGSVKQVAPTYVPYIPNWKERNADTNKNPYNYYDAFDNHNIPDAWDAGLSGYGTKTAIIDGGLDINDAVFGNGGNSNGSNPASRSVSKKGYYKYLWWNPWSSYDGPWASSGIQLPFGHGTSMAELIGGPLGNETGVAYNANLVSVRSAWGVWIDPVENMIGVSRAYEKLSKKDDVKVISMSQGSIMSNVWVTRAIQKCYDKGKLLFAAGGTFFVPGVQQFLTAATDFTLFPARLPTVNSCTGIKKLSQTANIPVWCTSCFGVAKFTFEFNEGLLGTEGSSSVSTASTAGMASLIWAHQPSLTRDQVLNKMIQASDYPNNPHPYYGHGRVDMRRYLINEGLISKNQ